jgi:hypothetical protein
VELLQLKSVVDSLSDKKNFFLLSDIVSYHCTGQTTTSCASGWSQAIVGQSMANGVYQRSLTTDDCKLACIATTGCIAIDIYLPSGSVLYCYLLFTSTALSSAPNFYHYDLQPNPNCVTVSEYYSALFYNEREREREGASLIAVGLVQTGARLSASSA